MRLIRTLPGPWVFILGFILLFCAAQLASVRSPALAAPAQHGQSRTSDSGQAHDKSPASPDAGKKKSATAGNGSSSSGKAEGMLVAEVLLLLVVGRVLGEGMQRIGQPALMGTLLAGIVLGPSLFGWVWPAAQQFLFPGRGAERHDRRPVADRHSDAAAADRHGDRSQAGAQVRLRGAVAIALCGIAFPFACGFLLGQFGPAVLFGGAAAARLVPSLFLGTALSISSIKIVAMVVREMNFMRRNLGQIIVATAIMEDTCGWVIIAITFGIAGAGGRRRRHRA